MSSLTTDALLGLRPAEPRPLALLVAAARRALHRRALRRAETEALARLSETSAHLLDDVGLADRAPLAWRAEPSAWDAPHHWLR